MVKHYDIRITGVVQGVAYRASAKDKALSLGLKGYVKNEADGSVSVAAEGEKEVLDEFMEWCEEGPPAAKVDNVECSEGTLQYYSKFVISH